MSQPPPPPPPAIPPAPAPGGARPPLVTAAAVLLFIAGGFAALGGLAVLLGAAVSSVFIVFSIVFLAIAAAYIYSGVQILGGHERGRIVALVVVGIGALGNLVFIGRAPASSVVGLAIDAFVIYALVSAKGYFHQ